MRFFSLLVAFFISSSADAFLEISDYDYYVFKAGNYNYIYSKSDLKILPELIHYNNFINEFYQSEYKWTLDEEASLILASPKNQIANGFATVFPNVMTTFYPGGPSMVDFFASSSWRYTLLNHEVAHLYQLNAKEENSPSTAAKTFLGNTPFVGLLAIPIFTHPNALLPTYALEGNATFNESRFGIGGRLYSGELRAITFAQLKAGLLSYKRLLNSHIDFPYGTEKYVLGAYFDYYLAETYGIEKANEFLKNHTTHYIWPFRIDAAYKKTYGKGYEELFEGFKQRFLPVANKQRASSVPANYKSTFKNPINKIGDEIVFLATGNSKSAPTLVTYNLKTNSFSDKKTNFRYGEVFKVDGDYYVATSSQVETTRLSFTLLDESEDELSEYNDKFVLDINGSNTAYFKTTEGFTDNQLYVNNNYIGTAHSSAILDSRGNVYYFKQLDDKRVLFKNKQKLTQFAGYQSYPVEVSSNGTVYFIAPSIAGSSLFSFKNGQIKQVLDYDTIVDARMISPNKALVTEVTAEGYEHKILPLEPRNVKPVKYDYIFDKYQLKNTYQKPVKAKDLKHTEETIIAQSQPYSMLKNIRYSSTDLFFTGASDSSSTGIQIGTTFADPLFQNFLFMSIKRSPYKAYAGTINYTNQKYRLNWGLELNYNESVAFNTITEEVVERYPESQYNLLLGYTLFKGDNWQSSVLLSQGYEREELLTSGQLKAFNTTGVLNISNRSRYPIGYLPYYYYMLSYGVAYEDQEFTSSQIKTNTKLDFARLRLIRDTFWNIYFDLSADWAYSESRDIDFDYELSLQSQDNSQQLTTDSYKFTNLLPGKDTDVDQLSLTRLRLLKDFHTPLYFTVWPVSLRRLAPYALGFYYDLRNSLADAGANQYLSGYGAGVELELLIWHSGVARVRYEYFKDNNNETYGNFVLSSSF